jgi:hypothetical protein
VPFAATLIELSCVHAFEPDATETRLSELAPTPSEYTTALKVLMMLADPFMLEASVDSVVEFVVMRTGRRRKLNDPAWGSWKATAADVEFDSTKAIFETNSWFS